LNAIGDYLGLLGLRLLLAWEFGEAGVEKFRGVNWFAEIQDRFPFPFNVIPAELSWHLVTWIEIGGAIALMLGLGTRVFGLAADDSHRRRVGQRARRARLQCVPKWLSAAVDVSGDAAAVGLDRPGQGERG
jgi:hypothetical protein